MKGDTSDMVRPECGSHHGRTSQSGFTRDPHQKLKLLENKVQGEIMEREELIKVIQKYNLGKSGLLLNLFMHRSHPNGFKNLNNTKTIAHKMYIRTCGLNLLKRKYQYSA